MFYVGHSGNFLFSVLCSYCIFQQILSLQEGCVFFFQKAVNSATAQNKQVNLWLWHLVFSARQPTWTEQAQGAGRIILSVLPMSSWFHSWFPSLLGGLSFLLVSFAQWHHWLLVALHSSHLSWGCHGQHLLEELIPQYLKSRDHLSSGGSHA